MLVISELEEHQEKDLPGSDSYTAHAEVPSLAPQAKLLSDRFVQCEIRPRDWMQVFVGGKKGECTF